MVNPISTRPEHALYPAPEGCTGHRIFQMLRSRVPEVTTLDYLRVFRRVNLCVGEWDPDVARRVATSLIIKERVLVLLGREVQKAFHMPPGTPDVLPVLETGLFAGRAILRCLPHPSGRNLWYNDPVCWEAASLLLEELYVRGDENGDS
jgi:hypothetical protein